jgi:hypothetical protein
VNIYIYIERERERERDLGCLRVWEPEEASARGLDQIPRFPHSKRRVKTLGRTVTRKRGWALLERESKSYSVQLAGLGL